MYLRTKKIKEMDNKTTHTHQQTPKNKENASRNTM